MSRWIELGIFWRDRGGVNWHAATGLGHEEDHLRATARAQHRAQVDVTHRWAAYGDSLVRTVSIPE